MPKTSRDIFLGSLFAALAFAPLARAATPQAGSNELRLEPSKSVGSGTSSANVYGVNWALAGYF